MSNTFICYIISLSHKPSCQFLPLPFIKGTWLSISCGGIWCHFVDVNSIMLALLHFLCSLTYVFYVFINIHLTYVLCTKLCKTYSLLILFFYYLFIMLKLLFVYKMEYIGTHASWCKFNRHFSFIVPKTKLVIFHMLDWIVSNNDINIKNLLFFFNQISLNNIFVIWYRK